ncbi:MAG: LuxR C-terminal-related transcriptional regulator [Hydrogenophaga sp.]|uniref:LuxR C-terminal-related transcriptional regulator n=1 Tax=Ottowia sp. TaxID=1898956 RepID=UPI0026047C96|nr:LuxR C-terminal-related transcriptional regulator [Ottowia sp.]
MVEIRATDWETARGVRASSLATKLSPPQSAAFEIARTHLCERIFNAGAARLVVLRAPAGFGKTTVMLQARQRFEETGLATGWLRLDRADNDLGRFLVVLAAALDPVVPGLARISTAAQTGGAEDFAFALIDRVAAHPAPFALFLDDFEALQNPAALGLVNELIDQLPRGAQLIVGSRGVPGLSLGRLRARGRLLEIEPAQLRFSVAEASGFLCERRGLALEPGDVLRLHRSTEGWPAALWLASVSLEHREQPSRFIGGFSGSNAAVVDYLVEDVLARQDEDVRGFLLRTSILADLNASLCNTICARSDSEAMLRKLELAHLFLSPLQSEGDGYRYHGMFAEFLRAQLERQYPEEVPRLHRAAAQWFLEQSRPVPAIEHGLSADDLAFSLPLLLAHAQPLLDQGRVRLLSRWLDPLLDRGVLDPYPMLRMVHAWAVCFARGPRAAAPLLDRLDQSAGSDDEVRAHRLGMRPMLMVLTDQTDEATQLTAALLDELPLNVSFVRGLLEVTLANLVMIAGRYHEALRLADVARSRQTEGGSSFNLALSEAAESAVDLTQGRLRKALARLRLAVSAGAVDATRATNGNAMVGVLLAEALFEADGCEQAERLLAVYIPLIRHVGIPDQLILAHVLMARIAQDRGDGDRSLQLLAELEHIGHRDGLPRVVASARLERVRLLLTEGQLARARAEIDHCGNRALWARVSRSSLRANEVETHALAVARWSVLAGHAADVVVGLRAELDAAERAQRERRALTLRLLLAQALHCTGQRNKAMRVLARAVRFAAGEGYVRAFLIEGPQLLMLLRELREGPTELLEEGGDTALVFLDGLLRRPPSVSVEATVARPSGVAVVDETLTRKELQVLRLVAEGLSNDQIGERMFVAETTIRTHLRNINVKLDTRNRTEAVQVARRAGWLT